MNTTKISALTGAATLLLAGTAMAEQPSLPQSPIYSQDVTRSSEQVTAPYTSTSSTSTEYTRTAVPPSSVPYPPTSDTARFRDSSAIASTQYLPNQGQPQYSRYAATGASGIAETTKTTRYAELTNRNGTVERSTTRVRKHTPRGEKVVTTRTERVTPTSSGGEDEYLNKIEYRHDGDRFDHRGDWGVDHDRRYRDGFLDTGIGLSFGIGTTPGYYGYSPYEPYYEYAPPVAPAYTYPEYGTGVYVAPAYFWDGYRWRLREDHHRRW